MCQRLDLGTHKSSQMSPVEPGGCPAPHPLHREGAAASRDSASTLGIEKEKSLLLQPRDVPRPHAPTPQSHAQTAGLLRPPHPSGLKPATAPTGWCQKISSA